MHINNKYDINRKPYKNIAISLVMFIDFNTFKTILNKRRHYTFTKLSM